MKDSEDFEEHVVNVLSILLLLLIKFSSVKLSCIMKTCSGGRRKKNGDNSSASIAITLEDGFDRDAKGNEIMR